MALIHRSYLPIVVIAIGSMLACTEREGEVHQREGEVQMNGKLITRTQTVRQAELEVSVPEKARQNEPTDLIIRLKNLGQRPVEFGHTNGYRDCKIQIFDAAQRPCPYTAFGYQMMGGEDGVFKKRVLTPVDPSKSHEWRVDIAKCFQLKPGRYSIAVSLELNPITDAFKIVVDDVVFDVI